MSQDLLKNIISEIEDKIDSVDTSPEIENVWEVFYLWDSIAKVSWLRWVSYNEVVEFESWWVWVALNLEDHFVWVVILEWFSSIREWEKVKASKRILEVPVWDSLVWRVVDSLWNPIDWLWELKNTQKYPVERVASWVMSRKSVFESMETWIKAIDALVPIWRWQRELIMWDRQVWKTQIAIDAILNQKWQNMICVYVATWQKEWKVSRIVEELRKRWAMEYTIVVSASSSDPAAMQYLSPYSWCAMAEYFMLNWKHALVIYDDLTKHANAYREMSLLLRKPPWREAYPWDVFYLHSRLLERAAKLNDQLWWWSITALPIIETQAWDVSAYIPTNVISITDWQIFLETDLFNSWQKPAIHVWLSVSRVWWAAQIKAMKKVSWTLKLDLAQYRELAAFSQFASDLDESTKAQLERWKRMMELLKQDIYSPVPVAKQVCAIYAWWKWYLDQIKVESVKKFESDLYASLDEEKSILESLEIEKVMSEDTEKRLIDLIEKVVELNK